MDSPPLRIAYLTAGAAGMYCGSCMHDNTLAAELTRMGIDIQLIPTYTPIRTDEANVSVDRVFFGGVNVFLQQKFRIFRHLPPLLDRVFDQPWFLRWATSRAVDIDPKLLGGLAVSMLRGQHGYQRKEVRRLCRFLASSVKPNLVALTNLLIGGCIPEMKRHLSVPLLVTLQGDDVFLDQLPEPYRSQAFAELRKLVPLVDGFMVNSRYYANFMQAYLGIPADRIHQIPLGIDTRDFVKLGDRQLRSGELEDETNTSPTRPLRIGYLARLAPEKGLHLLVDAYILLRREMEHNDPTNRSTDSQHQADVQLWIAGWLGEHQRAYVDEQFAKLNDAGLMESVHYVGSIDRAEKLQFLSQLDVLSVPTTYRDPKGLYVLEALAAGVPVVQPAHGAFPELIEATGGGLLCTPDDPAALAAGLRQLLGDESQRRALAVAGRGAIMNGYHAQAMAEATLDVFLQYTVAR